MKILVTGAAGFIGQAVSLKLLESGDEVVGIDNINSYYDVQLKYHRLSLLGINKIPKTEVIQSDLYPNFKFIQMDIKNYSRLESLFNSYRFDYVCNLAAQAGVRYSIKNPRSYINSNLVGFFNIIELCRHYSIKHLVYASSSSVYGLNANVPFSEQSSIAHPASLYAATKKSNELIAHSYSSLFHIPTTGLRFFTVYGPYGRPDMSPFLFTDAILKGKPIKIFNHGDMLRDFTYIADITEGIARVLKKIPFSTENWDPVHPDPSCSLAPYRIFNIGNSQPIKLMDFIEEIEKACGKEAKKEFLPMQPGDVYQTNADTTLLNKEIGYKPATPLFRGITAYVEWHKNYYCIK